MTKKIDYLDLSKPKRTRKKPVLSSFSPYFAQLLERVGTDRVSVKVEGLETRGKGIHLRQRLYTFRSVLKDEGHPLYDLCSSTYIADPEFDEDTGTWYLMVHPQDRGYDDHLAAALEKSEAHVPHVPLRKTPVQGAPAGNEPGPGPGPALTSDPDIPDPEDIFSSMYDNPAPNPEKE